MTRALLAGEKTERPGIWSQLELHPFLSAIMKLWRWLFSGDTLIRSEKSDLNFNIHLLHLHWEYLFCLWKTSVCLKMLNTTSHFKFIFARSIGLSFFICSGVEKDGLQWYKHLSICLKLMKVVLTCYGNTNPFLLEKKLTNDWNRVKIDAASVVRLHIVTITTKFIRLYIKWVRTFGFICRSR